MATTEEKGLEQKLVAKGLTAARVTPDHIDSIIEEKHFFSAADGLIGMLMGDFFKENPTGSVDDELVPHDQAERLKRTTICVLVLANGGIQLGVNYCPVSAENWNADVARELAEKDARNKLWELEGYVLRQRLFEQRREENEIADALADFQESDCEGCKI